MLIGKYKVRSIVNCSMNGKEANLYLHGQEHPVRVALPINIKPGDNVEIRLRNDKC